MRNLGWGILLCSLMLGHAVATFADGVTVTAIVDRNQVGLGDVVNLTVSISAQNSVQVEEPRLPTLNGFELINTSSGMETRSSFVNGKFLTTQARNFTYMLAVNQKGNLTIPAIPVVVEGQTYRTQPIQVSATNARPSAPPQAGRGQQDPFQEMDDMEELFNQMLQRRLAPNGGAPGGQGGGGTGQFNPNDAFLIVAETDKNKAYVGEQITANFYLYTRGQVRDIDTLKYPDLKGFWKEELEMATRLNFEQAVINGIPYQRALLVSYALFPIKPGKIVVDPYKAKCTVLTPSAFGFGHPYVFTKASRAINIDVADVPTTNRPSNFSGAVGHFRVTAQFEPPTGTVNQPVTMRVRFEGQGNAKLIELPKLELPPSFEMYDQKSQAKFMRDGTSYKEFEVLMIPRQPGVFNLAPVAASVFDPGTGKFTNVASQPLNITVTGTATTPAPPGLPQTGSAVDAKTSSEPALPPLATESGSPPLRQSVTWAVTGLIYLLVLGYLVIYGWMQLRRPAKRTSLKLVLKRRLHSISDLAAKGDWRRVGVELTNATYFILGQLSDQGGATQELARLLEHTPPSLRNELAAPIEKLLAQSEALSFAPEAMIGDMQQKPKLEALIKEFESVMVRAIELAEV